MGFAKNINAKHTAAIYAVMLIGMQNRTPTLTGRRPPPVPCRVMLELRIRKAVRDADVGNGVHGCEARGRKWTAHVLHGVRRCGDNLPSRVRRARLAW